MKSKKIVSTLLILALLPTAPALMAGPPDGPPPGDEMVDGPFLPPPPRHSRARDGRRSERRLSRLSRFLDLTREQEGKIKKIWKANDKKVEEKLDQMKPIREELRKLIEVDKPDLKAIRERLTKISSIHVDLQMIRIEEHLQIEEILTAGQKQKLKEARKERMERRRDRYDRRR